MATPPPETTHENGCMQINWAIFSKENGGIHIVGEKSGYADMLDQSRPERSAHLPTGVKKYQ